MGSCFAGRLLGTFRESDGERFSTWGCSCSPQWLWEPSVADVAVSAWDSVVLGKKSRARSPQTCGFIEVNIISVDLRARGVGRVVFP
jgi:hypothetical protein